MKNFTSGEAKFFLGVPRGAEWPDFKKIEKSLYRTVVSTRSRNFSILAELETILKLGSFWGVLGPPLGDGWSNFKNLKKAPYRMLIRTYSQNFSNLAQLKSVKTNKIGQNVQICNPSFVTRERELTVLNSSSL